MPPVCHAWQGPLDEDSLASLLFNRPRQDFLTHFLGEAPWLAILVYFLNNARPTRRRSKALSTLEAPRLLDFCTLDLISYKVSLSLGASSFADHHLYIQVNYLLSLF